MPTLPVQFFCIILHCQKRTTVRQNDNNSLFTPVEIGIILLSTFVLFVVFAFVTGFLNESVSMLLGELMMVIPAVVFTVYKRMPFAATFRFNRVNLQQTAATFLFFIPLFILADELDRLIQMLFPMPTELLDALYNVMTFNSIGHAVALIVAGVFVAALSEEMLFRGVLQHTLEKFRDPAMAIVSSAVFFTLAHFNPWASIQILLLGLVFGYVTWKSQSILPAILLHGLNNLLSLIMINLPEESLNWYARGDHVNWIWVLLSLLCIAPIFRLIAKVFFNSRD